VGLAALALVLFGLATLVVLWVAATTADGPILWEISATHGIHRRDVLTGIRAYGAAATLWAIAAAITLHPRPTPR
jgi:hypothetical protein